MDVFVGNLPPGTTTSDLERLFARYAGYCRFLLREQRASNGWPIYCAIGCVLPDADARRAMRALNLREFRGRALMVMEYLGRKGGPAVALRPAPLKLVADSPARGTVVAAAGLFRRRRKVEQRRRERRQSERRDGERRNGERRVGDRRHLSPPSADPAAGERFNNHRSFQRRVDERRSGSDRRNADRRHQDRRD